MISWTSVLQASAAASYWIWTWKGIPWNAPLLEARTCLNMPSHKAYIQKRVFCISPPHQVFAFEFHERQPQFHHSLEILCIRYMFSGSWSKLGAWAIYLSSFLLPSAWSRDPLIGKDKSVCLKVLMTFSEGTDFIAFASKSQSSFTSNKVACRFFTPNEFA